MRQTFLALTLAAVGTVGAFADTINTNSVPTQFTNLSGQTFLTSGINSGQVGAAPFFVNPSTDAGFNQGTNRDFSTKNIATANLNLGNFLTGNGDWTGNALSPGLAASNLNLLNNTSNGTGNPQADPANFFFNGTGSTYQMTLLLSLTGDTLEFGWYNTASPGTLNALFSNAGCFGALNANGTPAQVTNTCAKGAQGAGGATTVAFTPSATYGFYIKFLNTGGYGAGWTGYTQGSLNNFTGGQFGLPAGAESPLHQHFALLQNNSSNGRFYLGVEDSFFSTGCSTASNGPCREGNGDYQDFVVQFDITPNAVPEPASIGMMAAGLLALGAIARRRRS